MGLGYFETMNGTDDSVVPRHSFARLARHAVLAGALQQPSKGLAANGFRFQNHRMPQEFARALDKSLRVR